MIKFSRQDKTAVGMGSFNHLMANLGNSFSNFIIVLSKNSLLFIFLNQSIENLIYIKFITLMYRRAAGGTLKIRLSYI